MLKILQAWLQQYVNRELPDVQAGGNSGNSVRLYFWGLQRTRDQIANIYWIMEKVAEKHLFLLY